MSDTAPTPKPPPLRPFYRRPLEWGMIGLFGVAILWSAKFLGVLPERLDVLGAEAEFSQEDKAVLVQNDQLISELRAELDKLRADVAILAAQERNGLTVLSPEQILEAPADQGPISDSFLAPDVITNGQGVIWIGEWDPVQNGWTDGTIEAISGRLPPPQMMDGTQVRLTKTVNVRESLPSRDESYYRNVPVLGIADIGSVATVNRVAPAYRRATGIQYWAEVTVDFQPKEEEALEATRSLSISTN